MQSLLRFAWLLLLTQRYEDVDDPNAKPVTKEDVEAAEAKVAAVLADLRQSVLAFLTTYAPQKATDA